LFDFEREFSPQSATRIVASESLKLSAEQRQRDVFETHRHRVFAVSYYMTANEVEAEHILADTFVNAFARQQEPDAAGVDRALLAQLERRFSLAPTEAAVPDADLILVRASTRRIDMEEALRVLPPAERLVFLLKDVEGYNAGKIAGLLDRPEREILRTLFSARIRMRNALAAVQEARQREKNDPEVNQAQPEEASAPA
jgi:RNA polymerase sigma-70 factor (ECF subfamily)